MLETSYINWEIFKVYEHSSLFKFMNSSSFQIYNLEFPGLSFQLFPWLLYTHMYPYSYIYMKLFSILILIFLVQFSSVTQSCLILCDPMDFSMPCFPAHYQLPELAQTCFHLIGDAIHPSHPLSSSSSPAPNPSQHQGLFQWVNSSPKYWSFILSISSSNEHPGLNSFRMDWLDLLAVQGTLKSLLQHHSSKASVLPRLALFMVQLSHPYVTNGNTIAWTIWTFGCRLAGFTLLV